MKQFFPLGNTSTALTDTGLGQHFILSLALPNGIWPGEWFYLSRTVEHCPLLPSLFRPYIHESVDVPIHIEDPKPPTDPAELSPTASNTRENRP